MGDRVLVPSALTGAVLEYFVPHPLPDVAARFSPRERLTPFSGDDDIAAILPLIPVLATARRGRAGCDATLMDMHVQVVLGRRRLQTSSDLIALGNEINGDDRGLRRQIVYSGGPTPSTARVLFPPPSEVPPLFDAMAEFLGSDVSTWNAFDLAVLVCEHAARVHPFNDGNGRWARLLALDAGRRAGSLWAGACAGILNQLRTQSIEYRDAYPHTTSIEGNIKACEALAEELSALMLNEGMVEKCRNLLRFVSEYEPKAVKALALAATIDSASIAPLDQLTRGMGWSLKKAQGFVHALNGMDIRCVDTIREKLKYMNAFSNA